MLAAKEKFRQVEEQERLNPNNMLIRILVICTHNFYEENVLAAARARYGVAEITDWAELNRLYALFVAKSCNIYDLKRRLDSEMGLPFDNT